MFYVNRLRVPIAEVQREPDYSKSRRARGIYCSTMLLLNDGDDEVLGTVGYYVERPPVRGITEVFDNVAGGANVPRVGLATIRSMSVSVMLRRVIRMRAWLEYSTFPAYIRHGTWIPIRDIDRSVGFRTAPFLKATAQSLTHGRGDAPW